VIREVIMKILSRDTIIPLPENTLIRFDVEFRDGLWNLDVFNEETGVYVTIDVSRNMETLISERSQIMRSIANGDEYFMVQPFFIKEEYAENGVFISRED
jgi:hypothetical protein